jgi:hypothetical protein
MRSRQTFRGIGLRPRARRLSRPGHSLPKHGMVSLFGLYVPPHKYRLEFLIQSVWIAVDRYLSFCVNLHCVYGKG